MKIALCLPNYGPVSPRYVQGIAELLVFENFVIRGQNYYISEVILSEKVFVDKNRNDIVEEAIKRGADCTFWIDSDVIVPKDALLKLVRHEKDIVSGLYVKKNTSEPTAYRKKEDGYHALEAWPQKPFKVDAVGMGCVLIKTEVFRKLDYPWFAYDVFKNIGEDFYFCEKAREKFEIWIDPSVTPVHLVERGMAFEGVKDETLLARQ